MDNDIRSYHRDRDNSGDRDMWMEDGGLTMDDKGRPTRLEDIISAEMLMAVMTADSDKTTDEVKADIHNNPQISNQIIKAVERYIIGNIKSDPRLMIGI